MKASMSGKHKERRNELGCRGLSGGAGEGVMEALWCRDVCLDQGKILVHRNLSAHVRKGGV